MDKGKIVKQVVEQWLKIAERDLLTAKQGLEADIAVTDTICFHCQQAAEKFLKAFLVNHQVEFTKIHNIAALLTLCSGIDKSFRKELADADLLTDYAVEIRYPDDWYEPTMEEAKQAYAIALRVKEFVLNKLKTG